MRVKVILLCIVKVGQFDNLLPFLEKNLPNVRSFAGNRQVTVLFDKANDMMLLDEIWASEKHHQDYLAAIEKSGVLAELGQFLTAPPTIQYFTELDL